MDRNTDRDTDRDTDKYTDRDADRDTTRIATADEATMSVVLQDIKLMMIYLPSKYYCSLPLWRVHEIKCTYLASCIHGLFIT